MLDNVSKGYPMRVKELMSLGTILRELQNLLREHVSIRDIRTILETLAGWAPATRDPELLIEFVRLRAGMQKFSGGRSPELLCTPTI